MSCPICGRIKANSPHHIIPKSVGGGDNKENITYLCKKCHDDVEEDPRLWARFLRCHYAIGMRGRKANKRKVKKVLMINRVFSVNPRGSKPDLRKGTPNWLAKELGVPGRVVRVILRTKYSLPLESKQSRSKWGILTTDQEHLVRKVTPLLNNMRLANLIVKLSSDTIGELLSQKLDHENPVLI